MKAIDALQGRNSAPRLTGNVSADQLEVIIRAGLRAPDHAQLRPWKILVIQNESRDRLGDLFVEAKRIMAPDHPEELLDKLRTKPHRAPVVIVVAASMTEHPKVPEVEQLLSAGAVAQNMLIAAHALGLGAMWRTGEMAYQAVVHQGLGLSEADQIVGFLYMGEIDGRVKSLPDHDESDFVTHW